MFGSATLDVLIGLVTVFAVVSLVASALGEAIAQHFGWRGQILRQSIRELLGDSERAVVAFYATPTIERLRTAMPWYEVWTRQLLKFLVPRTSPIRTEVERALSEGRLPSYIAEDTFVQGLFAIIHGPSVRADDLTLPELANDLCFPPGDGGIVNVPAETRDYFAQLALSSNGDLKTFEKSLVTCFNEKMDRSTGVFKRRMKPVLFVVGLVVAIAANIDAVDISTRLWQSAELRSFAVAQAESLAKSVNSTDPSTTQNQYKDALKALSPLFPPSPEDPWAIPHVLGLLITAIAASLGAPFWFDAMNSLLKLRGSVPVTTPTADKRTRGREVTTTPALNAVTRSASTLRPTPVPKPTALTEGMTGFDPSAAAHDPFNAMWCAELSLLAYERDASALGDALRSLGLTGHTEIAAENHQCFVAWNDKVIVAAFRGTETSKDERFADILTDASFKETPLIANDTSSPQVHKGFADAINRLWERLNATVDSASQTGQSLWLTGHSLGGALATLGAIRFTLAGREVKGVYTFGQPRCLASAEGTSRFEQVLADRIFRYVNHLDPVPALPPSIRAVTLAARAYRHFGACYLFDAEGHVIPNATQWLRYLGFWSIFCESATKEQLRQSISEVPADHRMAMYRKLVAIA